MSDPNLASYRRPGIIRYYSQLRKLQPAEEEVFQRLEPSLSQMSVLDLGVGAGRTTSHLAQRVFDYTGVDYSPEMIRICEQRFSQLGEHIRFQVCDVRDISEFPNQSFDFIFFSYNGIDSMSHQERLEFFQEVTRIGKSGGYFFFSTHNLQGMIREFSLQTKLSLNPMKTYVNGFMWGILRLFNQSLSLKKLESLDHAIIRDESHNFRLRQYYIRPRAQLQQLATYFKETTVYSWQTGQVIADHELEQQADMWLYYLCQLF